ncbi:MAG: ABC transporter ATP-binding protein, partial [Oscillospiraceae bacterium]
MVKKLLKSVREYKKETLLSPIFVSLEVVMEVIIPFLMAFLIDEGINKGDMGNIVKFGLILLVCCVLSLTFGALAGKYAAYASAGFAKNLRHDMYYKVQKYSFSNIDKFSTASIVTRLTTDVTNIQNAFQMCIRIAFRAPIMLIFSVVMAFMVNARLSLIFVAAIIILGGGLAYVITHAHPIFERVFKKYDKLNNVVQENLRGIRVVKSYVREDHEIDKFEETSEDIYKDFSKAEKLMALNNPLMQFCMFGCMLLISWFAAKLIVTSTMTTGELMSLITYTMQILMSLMMVSMILVMIVISRASVERVCEILDEESDIVNGENPVTKVRDGSISFKNVVFDYAKKTDRHCLDNINIDIPSGSTVGI